MRTINCIPAFNDNYIWLIVDDNKRCCVVDPGDAAPVIEFLESHQFTLTQIWLTHHHADHTGGVSALKGHYPDVDVYGPKSCRFEAIDHRLEMGDTVMFADHHYQILALPGHTLDHIAYYGEQTLFCGDVLFSAGCGRVFEGSYSQMFDSLNQIKALPANTKIYPTHEYTQANIDFALAADPTNLRLQHYQQQVLSLRGENKPSLPTTLELELEINPFLRCECLDTEQWQAKQALREPLDVFTYLRDWKNDF
jgi:hydroxyacylglutathione hydrolase